jgi:hypothetical protein
MVTTIGLSISDTAPSGLASINIPPHVATISVGFATWSKAPDFVSGFPGSANYDDNNNWSDGVTPGGSDTAFFGPTSLANIMFPVSFVFVGSWVFNSDASAYSFEIVELDFLGAGITVNGGSVTLDNFCLLAFSNKSTAGSATIIDEGRGLVFANESTAVASPSGLSPELEHIFSVPIDSESVATGSRLRSAVLLRTAAGPAVLEPHWSRWALEN